MRHGEHVPEDSGVNGERFPVDLERYTPSDKYDIPVCKPELGVLFIIIEVPMIRFCACVRRLIRSSS